MNGVRPLPIDPAQCEKKKRNYKLLVDPALKKGTEKIYRYDGVVPGSETLYPPVQIRDPRSRLALLWAPSEPADLVVPRFQIDDNYVGTPPAIQVTIHNLNDNINKQFLDDMLKKFGPLQQSEIYYHPKTRKHLRLAHITFFSSHSAKMCIETMNNTSVMGDVLSVYLDPFGRNCNQMFEEFVSGRCRPPAVEESSYSSSVPKSFDPRIKPLFEREKNSYDSTSKKVNVELPHQNCENSISSSTDLGYGSEIMNSKLSERSFSLQSEGSNFSSFSTPTGFDRDLSQKYGSHIKANAQPKQYGWEKKPSWDEEKSPCNTFPSKKNVTPPTTPATAVAKHSPTRESLDSRIELLLKQTDAKSSFLNLGSVSSQLEDVVKKSSRKSRLSSEDSWGADVPPLPPDSSLPPLPECEDPPPLPPDHERDNEDKLLNDPPSPFISELEYRKWALVTKDIDNGKSTSISDVTKRLQEEELRKTATLEGTRLPIIPWNSENDMEINNSPLSIAGGDSTPVQDEPRDNFLNNAAAVDDDDDDKMSLSSLSSGEDKLEINIPPLLNGACSSEAKCYSQASASQVVFPPNYSSQHIPQPARSFQSSVYHTFSAPGTTYPRTSSNVSLYSSSQNLYTSQNMYPPPLPTVPSVNPPPAQAIRPIVPPPGVPQPPPPAVPAPPIYPNPPMASWRPGMTPFPAVPDPSAKFSQSNFFPNRTPTPNAVPRPMFPMGTPIFTRPPPGYPYLLPPAAKHMPLLPSPYRLPEIKKSKHHEIINEVLECIVKELKLVMKKDVCKKMVEVFAFKCFEQWWDDHQDKTKEKEDDVEVASDVAKKLPTFYALNSLFDQNAKSSSSFGHEHFGLGLRATIPRMPSFRRKIKPPSPPPLDEDEDSKKAEDSDAEKEKSDSDVEPFVVPRRKQQFYSEDDESSNESEKASEASESASEESSDYESSGEESDFQSDRSESDFEGEDELQADLSVSKQDHAEIPELTSEERISETADTKAITIDFRAPLRDVLNQQDRSSPLLEDSFNESSDILKDEAMDLLSQDTPSPRAADVKKNDQADVDALAVAKSESMDDAVVQVDKPTPSDAGPEVQKQKANQDSRTLEASHALMALASCFTDFGSYPGTEMDTEKQMVAVAEESGETKPINGEMIYSPETTLSADEATHFEDDEYDSDMYDVITPNFENMSKIDWITSEHNYTFPTSSKNKIRFHIPPLDKSIPQPDLDKDIPSSPQTVTDHEYTKAYHSPLKPIQNEVVRRPYKRKRKHSVFEKKIPEIILPEQPKTIFPKRTDVEDMVLLYRFLCTGIDAEDVEYAQRSYNLILQDDTNTWVNDTHWVDHPATMPSPAKKKKKDENVRTHISGSARSEGYYKLDVKEKVVFNHSAMSSVDVDNDLMEANKVKTTAQSNREARSNQRRLLTSFGEADFYSDLLKFNQLKFRKKQLKFARSRIHDWGLFALEPIAADEMVIEYVGQSVRPTVADMREIKYTSLGVGSSYLFKVDVDAIIDATRCGNLARFINHSCNPNCYAKIITVEGLKKIVIYSKQPINVNEEITYDYKFPIEEEKIMCLCGAPQCRGTLN